jgi:very-short-patch-repair endonuclease
VLDELGLRYTWQTPVGKYVPDFIVTEIDVIIEADGPFGHFAKRDALRDKYLQEAGMKSYILKKKHIKI